MTPTVGQTVYLMVDALHVPCRVCDVTRRGGKTRLLLTPIAGTGTDWVDAHRVRVAPEDRAGRKEYHNA